MRALFVQVKVLAGDEALAAFCAGVELVLGLQALEVVLVDQALVCGDASQTQAFTALAGAAVVEAGPDRPRIEVVTRYQA